MKSGNKFSPYILPKDSNIYASSNMAYHNWNGIDWSGYERENKTTADNEEERLP